MGDSLYTQWLKEEVTDLQKAVFCYGIHGVMAQFESWLRRKGHIKD